MTQLQAKHLVQQSINHIYSGHYIQTNAQHKSEYKTCDRGDLLETPKGLYRRPPEYNNLKTFSLLYKK